MQSQIINIGTIHLRSLGNCGYCEDKVNGKWITTSFQCQKMKSEDYHQLINRGWRRCGTYYYKPHTEECCQQHRPYTIRLNVNNYNPRTNQQRYMNRFNRYLQGGEVQSSKIRKQIKIEINDEQQKDINIIQNHLISFRYKIQENRQTFLDLFQDYINFNCEIALNDDVFQHLNVFLVKCTKRRTLGQYGSNLVILLYHYNKCLFGENDISIENFSQLIRPYFQEQFFSNLTNFTCQISRNGYLNFKNETPVPIKKHNNMFQTSKPKSSTLAKEPLNFEIKVVKAQFEEDSYEIYKKYNIVVHKSIRESKDSYIDFLCLQALEDETILNEKGDKLTLGCHHIKYYIDNQLIGVGVVDIMPEGMSLVHFFYDPNFKKLAFGFIGSFKQIEFIKEKSQQFEKFKYYYMGIYIKKCSKMGYKGDFEPSELLCPIKYRYVFLQDPQIQIILNTDKYMLAEKQEFESDMNFDCINLEEFVKNEIKLNIIGKQFKIKQINPSFQKYFSQIFMGFVKKLGKHLSQKLHFGQF